MYMYMQVIVKYSEINHLYGSYNQYEHISLNRNRNHSKIRIIDISKMNTFRV